MVVQYLIALNSYNKIYFSSNVIYINIPFVTLIKSQERISVHAI